MTVLSFTSHFGIRKGSLVVLTLKLYSQLGKDSCDLSTGSPQTHITYAEFDASSFDSPWKKKACGRSSSLRPANNSAP